MDINKLEEANRIASQIKSMTAELDNLKRIIHNTNYYRLSIEISTYSNECKYIPLNKDQTLWIVKNLIETKEKELQELEKKMEEL